MKIKSALKIRLLNIGLMDLLEVIKKKKRGKEGKE
jgi:hypothetical protein